MGVVMPLRLETINVIAELERIGWAFEFAGENEIKCRCPFHDDDTPSCGINTEKRVFKCNATGCGTDGDIITFIARALNTTRRVAFEDLATRYDLEVEKTIEASLVERYHSAIWNAGPLLKELRKRGVSDEMIREYRLGTHGGRVTIPIPNERGQYVNIRHYMPGAPGPEKMRNTRGHGRIRLFPVGQLKYDTIVVCGGEIKAIVAAAMLNARGIGALAATAGEGGWDGTFTKQMRGKRAYVCFDVDRAGHVGADRVCARLKSAAKWVGFVHLPLDVVAYPTGDINDWVGIEGATVDDFAKLLEATDEWVPTAGASYDTSEEPTDVSLAGAVNAKYTGLRVRTKAVVAAMVDSPYVIPKRVQVTCDRDQDGCSACPIFTAEQDESGLCYADIPAESPGILEMVETPKATQRESLIGTLHMPPCKSVDFRPMEWYNVEDVRLSPQLEISTRSTERVMQPALCVGHGLELNEPYEMVGRMFPHPKTQQSVLLISQRVMTHDALSSYEPQASDLEELRCFQPRDWTVSGLQEKLDEIYDDLEANVTRIFMRRDMHLVVDLAYHSVLLLPFDGRGVKGWAEVLILGDSSQGKSETTLQLMNHYGLGEKVECKNATVAGLLGGLQQLGNRWFVTWGMIPTHDKRLVVLEELKGASVDVIAKLTDMRSSGIAEIPKIEKRRTHARTRLIALSNPRSDRPLAAYNFGVEAVKELVGGLEDIRRFDATLLVSSSEIDAATLNRLQRSRPGAAHRFTADLCRRCVLWAWTREQDQVVIADEAYSRILDESTRLCNIFTEMVPLVDRGSMRYKLARLATALACRTFSCDDDPRIVVVRPCHVEYVSAFLERVYSSTVFGYRDFSRAVLSTNELLSPDDVRHCILQTPFPSDFVEQLLYTNDIGYRDIEDWCGWEREDGLRLLSFLVRKHALVRSGRNYHKTSPFIELLKALRGSPELKMVERPTHIKEEF